MILVKAEDYAPVCPDCDCIKAFKVTLERVQPQAGKVHIVIKIGSELLWTSLDSSLALFLRSEIDLMMGMIPPVPSTITILTQL